MDASRLGAAIPVTDLPDLSALAAVITDVRFPLSIGIALLAGLVRGFSGFGSALIYVPLMAAVYGPRIAAPVFVLADLVTGFLFLATIWRKAHWNEIAVMAITAIIATQFGTLILQYADPIVLRYALCAFVAAVVVILASGWRYHGKPRLAITILVGAAAGLLGGAIQISGPPIILYWLGSGHAPDILRANFYGYFSIFSTASAVTYWLHGLLTTQVLGLALFAAPMMIAGMGGGSYLFRFASVKMYRGVGYVIAASSAIIGLPLFDKLFH